jgi:hypothetical protein
MSGASGDEGLADLAAAALMNAKASMSRIDEILSAPSEDKRSASSSSSSAAGPPPGLTPEQEVQWWQSKIASLSSNADSKAVVPSKDAKPTVKKVDSEKSTAKGSSFSRRDVDETDRFERRIAELSRSEAKGSSGSDEGRYYNNSK